MRKLFAIKLTQSFNNAVMTLKLCLYREIDTQKKIYFVREEEACDVQASSK
jgi:hypothetical protein